MAPEKIPVYTPAEPKGNPVVGFYGIRRYPTGYIHNAKLDKYHPVMFRPGPQPSWEQGEPMRWKSIGHHTEGFPSLEDARAWATTRDEVLEIYALWEWDGEEVPAIVTYFDADMLAKVS